MLGVDWQVVRAVFAKDIKAVSRSKAIVIPMIAVPGFLLLIVPILLGLSARGVDSATVGEFTASIPGLGDLAEPLLARPPEAQIYYLLFQYLLAPLFVIVPLMVAAVLAADTFAGEKERKTLEALLHLPVRERELFLAKLLTTLVPAVLISWTTFVGYAIIANVISWPKVGKLVVPNGPWLLLIFWVGPGVIAFGLGLIVRISARARSSQEANQLGGAVILPLIFMVMGQATTLLLLPPSVMFGFGVVMWVASIALFRAAGRRFTRDRLATNV